MVASHRPPRPQRIVVKPAKAHYRPPRPVRHCVLCDAILRNDHCAGDLVCDSHHHDDYNPRCDPRLDRRVLTLLTNAYPEPLSLLRALGTDDRDAVWDCVNRWRRRGVQIKGIRNVGYRLGR
jgi:biotin operon repressor